MHFCGLCFGKSQKDTLKSSFISIYKNNMAVFILRSAEKGTVRYSYLILAISYLYNINIYLDRDYTLEYHGQIN